MSRVSREVGKCRRELQLYRVRGRRGNGQRACGMLEVRPGHPRLEQVNPSLHGGPQVDRWAAHVDKGRPGRPPVMKNSFLPLHIHPHPCVELHAHQSPCCDISHVVHVRHVAMFAWVFGAIREPKWCRWPEVSRCAARAAAARLSTPLLRAGAAMALIVKDLQTYELVQKKNYLDAVLLQDGLFQ